MKLLGKTSIGNENTLRPKSPLASEMNWGTAGVKIKANQATRKNLVLVTNEKGTMSSEYKSIASDRRLQPGIAYIPTNIVVNTHGNIAIFMPNKALSTRGAIVQSEMIPQGFSGNLWVLVHVVVPCYLENDELLGELLFFKEETDSNFLTARIDSEAPFNNGKFPQPR